MWSGSIAELADASGIPESAIRCYLYDGKTPKLEKAIRLASTLGVPVETLAKRGLRSLVQARRAKKVGVPCSACGAGRTTSRPGRCRVCEVASPERIARGRAQRRETLVRYIERIRGGAKFGDIRREGGWKRYTDENPDLAAELDALRRERTQRVHKDAIPEGCYLVQCETSGLVKIGYSNDPNDRLRTLRIGSPTRLVLRGVLGGGRDMEATLHARFAHRRSHGEWYALTPSELSETLCGSMVPEPGSARRAKQVHARLAARAPRRKFARPDLVPERPRAARSKGGPHLAHLRSWAVAEGALRYTQKELAVLCGTTQTTVSGWLREAGIVAPKRHFFDRDAFLKSVFSA